MNRGAVAGVAADVRSGSKADIGKVRLMSALPPKADIKSRIRDVRFVPEADIGSSIGSPHPRQQAAPSEH
jgi:hypothetical protein